MDSMKESLAPPPLDPPPLAATATAAPAVAPAKPPVWPSLLAPFVAFFALTFASGTAVLVLALVSDPQLFRGNVQDNLEKWVEDDANSSGTILASLVPGELAFLGAAVLFALLARERPWKRLGFVRWKSSHSTVALAVLGTLGVQFLITLVAGWLIEEPSESLKKLGKLFSESHGLAAVGVGILMSVPPGLCEEALFRGFTQRGLMRRWHPAAAIGVSSLYFALAHWDVQHSTAVFPLGVWFGYVAWRTASVWPAVLCHFANNLYAFVVVEIWGDAETLEMPEGLVSYAVGAALVAVMIVAILRLMRTQPAER